MSYFSPSSKVIPQQLLQRFLCPLPTHTNQICPFGHSTQLPPTSPSDASPVTPSSSQSIAAFKFRRLSPAVCLNHLLGTCTAKVGRVHGLALCSAGAFHPTTGDLLNWENYEVKMESILAIGRKASSSGVSSSSASNPTQSELESAPNSIRPVSEVSAESEAVQNGGHPLRRRSNSTDEDDSHYDYGCICCCIILAGVVILYFARSLPAFGAWNAIKTLISLPF